MLWISLFVEVFRSVTAGFSQDIFPVFFSFKFASVGSLLVNSVKNEKKQLFHPIDWMTVKTVDPMTPLPVDMDICVNLNMASFI